MRSLTVLILSLFLVLTFSAQASPAPSDPCNATIGSDLSIYVPCLTIGTASLWLDLSYVDDLYYYLWMLTNAGTNSARSVQGGAWEYVTLGGTFTSTAFLTENSVVGGAGYNFWGGLYTSADGGKNFTQMAADKAVHINRLVFARSSTGAYTTTGYAAGGWQEYGSDTYLGKTVDSGNTWTNITKTFTTARKTILGLGSAELFPLYGLSVLDANTLFVIGAYNGVSPAEIYKSFDGGGSWQSAGKITPQSDETIYATSLRMFSTTTGIVISNKKLYRTVNGGSSWGALSTPWGIDQGTGNSYVSASFADANNGIALVGSQSKVYRTTDGGSHWNLVFTQWPPANNPSWAPDGTYPSVIYAQSASEIWAGGTDSRIWHSLDGGASWSVDNNEDGYTYIVGFQLIPGRTVPLALSRVSSSSPGANGYYRKAGGTTPTGSSCAATLSATGILHIPCLVIGDLSLWIDLVYFPGYFFTDDIIFALTEDVGVNP